MTEIKLVTDHISWESSREDGKADAAVAQKSTNHRWSPNGRYLLLRLCFGSGSHLDRSLEMSREIDNVQVAPETLILRSRLNTVDSHISVFIAFRELNIIAWIQYCSTLYCCKDRTDGVAEPVAPNITCFRAIPVLKILGPIRDFVLKTQTNFKWLSKEFHSVRTSGDRVNFRVKIPMIKAHDMLTLGNVTINRAAHEGEEMKKIRCKWLPIGDKESDSLPLTEFQSAIRKRVAHVRMSLNCRWFNSEKPGKDHEEGQLLSFKRLSYFAINYKDSDLKNTKSSYKEIDIKTTEEDYVTGVDCPSARIINATHTKVYASARYRLPENLLRGGSLRCTAPPAATTKRYLRGGKAAQSSMIPSHMFAEHQRHQKRVPGGFACWRKGPPRRTCRLLESRKHESAKGVPPAPAAPKTGRSTLEIADRDTSSSRSWGSVGHVATMKSVHESSGGVHSRDHDRQSQLLLRKLAIKHSGGYSKFPQNIPPTLRQRRRKNAGVRVPLCNVTGNKVTLFRQCLRSPASTRPAEVSSSEKAPITEKKSVYQRDNATGAVNIDDRVDYQMYRKATREKVAANA
ncbi:hypothetical protein EAG_07972 [Camponotus floridanus]|uniref:Uncharacterized protein n=1 Tax=Camponotus floridanus TaxID=104421 RepID=E2ACW7_CAMFO|nr:hypothetical protein EAG_07972 [Camponotus floridanus]